MTMHLETRAIHAPAAELNGSRPVSVPIYQTSVFAFDDAAACARALDDPGGGFAYSRYANPTTSALERPWPPTSRVARRPWPPVRAWAPSTRCCSSSLRPGDHVIAQQCLYGGTFAVFTALAARYGIDVSYVSGRTPPRSPRRRRPGTRLLFLETIANPTIAVSDLPALIAAGHQAGLTCVVDNTFATPVLCRPHRARRGHRGPLGHQVPRRPRRRHARAGDLRPGVSRTGRCGSTPWTSASPPDPFAAWLTLRGLKTLALRMERHCANAAHLARKLAAHPAVTRVHWPGLPDHPDHATARRILTGFGGMVAFDLAGGREAGLAFVSRAAAGRAGRRPWAARRPWCCTRPPRRTARWTRPACARRASARGSIRVSVGLEHPDDLWADFEQALAAL